MQNHQKEKEPEACRKCEEILSPLYRFSCEHKLCIECIYRTMFIEYIQLFSEPSTTKEFKCRSTCFRKGTIKLTQDQIIDIINARNVSDKYKQCKAHENKEKIKDYYCRECNLPVCFDCCLLDHNKHNEHINSIESSEIYAQKIRTFFELIPLKSSDSFIMLIDKIGAQFKKVIENDYNTTLNEIDLLIQEVINVRATYASNYKKVLEEGINSLKIIKMFYLNYYYDFKKRKDKSKDINFLKYINDIKYQLNDASIKQNENIAQLIQEAQIKIKEIKKAMDKPLKISFDLIEIPNVYTIFQKCPDAHKKIVSSVIQGYDETIITGGADYSIKLWEETNMKYAKVFEIPQCYKQILALLQINDGRIWSTSPKENNIRIWIKELENYKCQQTLSLHEKCINTLLLLRDARVASGSFDNTIIIWKDTGRTGFQNIQKLVRHTEGIYALLETYDLRIVSAADDASICIWKEEDGHFKLNQKLKKHNKKIRALCQLKDGRIASGGEENNIFLWKTNENKLYDYMTDLQGHTNSINVIISLSDGRLASGSKDSKIIIWKMTDSEYTKSEVLEGHTNSVYVLIQLRDGRLCTGGSDSSIIFWKNRENLV